MLVPAPDALPIAPVQHQKEANNILANYKNMFSKKSERM